MERFRDGELDGDVVAVLVAKAKRIERPPGRVATRSIAHRIGGLGGKQFHSCFNVFTVQQGHAVYADEFLGEVAKRVNNAVAHPTAPSGVRP